jgi:hypothetical protein
MNKTYTPSRHASSHFCHSDFWSGTIPLDVVEVAVPHALVAWVAMLNLSRPGMRYTRIMERWRISKAHISRPPIRHSSFKISLELHQSARCSSHAHASGLSRVCVARAICPGRVCQPCRPPNRLRAVWNLSCIQRTLRNDQ